jgi:hypothetical protein
MQGSGTNSVIIEDWNLEKPSGGGDCLVALYNSTNLTARRCIFRSAVSTNALILCSSPVRAEFENCLLLHEYANNNVDVFYMQGSTNTTTIRFRYCTIVNTATSHRSLINLAGLSANDASVDSVEIVGCIFRKAGTVSPGAILRFDTTTTRGRVTLSNGNVFSEAAAASQVTAFVVTGSVTHTTLADWQTATSLDADSIESHASAPHATLFVDETARDYQLPVGSPARDFVALTTAGITTAVDLTGRTRPQNGYYDVGCYEAVGGLPFLGPGIRIFQLPAVTGIFPFRQDTLVASSRRPQRQERGGNIAVWRPNGHASDPLFLALDDGAAILGQKSMPAWGTSSGGAGTALGTSELLTKLDQSYSWVANDGSSPRRFRGQWGAGELFNGLQRGVGSTAADIIFTVTRPLAVNELQGCTLECTTGDASGVALGQRRRITRSTVTSNVLGLSLHVEPAFAATPTTTNRFRVVGPALKVRAQDKHVDSNTGLEHDYMLSVLENDAHTITFEDSQTPDVFRLVDLSVNQDGVSFEVGQEARYMLSGTSWSATFDHFTGRFLIVNGEDDMLAYDGRRLSVAQAEWDVTVSPLAADFTGTFQEDLAKGGDRVNPSSYLDRNPAKGRYICSFAGRIWVANDNEIRWSAPGAFNKIWPNTLFYYTKIDDPDGSPITGLEVLNDEIYAFTATSIWAAPPPTEQAGTTFLPRSKGVGFYGRTVGQMVEAGRSLLLGANADGVYIFSGSEPEAVLGEWKDVLPAGVNKGAMHKASAAVSRYDKRYYLAIPSAGSSVCDRVLVYKWDRRSWWVWEAPYGGVSSMGVDRDELGRETVVFGFEDGHIGVLKDMDYDDAVTVTGTARSIPVQPSSDTYAMTGLMVTAKAMGGSDGLTVRTFLDKSPVPRQQYSNDWDSGEPQVGDQTNQVVFRDDAVVTRRVNLPAGSRGSVVQYEVSGTSQWKLREVDVLLTRLGQRSRR